MFIKLSRVYSLDIQIAGNSIRQIGELPHRVAGTLSPFLFGRREQGYLFQPEVGDERVIIVKKAKPLPEAGERVIQGEINAEALEIDLSNGLWLKHPLLHRDNSRRDVAALAQETLNTWNDCFSYLEESRSSGSIGLRPPQLGALHGTECP
ncbi:MAG: hypothetical protein RLY66_667 [Candidatus Parcubacteria bacterium]|jgi:hypothetical protein